MKISEAAKDTAKKLELKVGYTKETIQRHVQSAIDSETREWRELCKNATDTLNAERQELERLREAVKKSASVAFIYLMQTADEPTLAFEVKAAILLNRPYGVEAVCKKAEELRREFDANQGAKEKETHTQADRRAARARKVSSGSGGSLRRHTKHHHRDPKKARRKATSKTS